MGRKTLSLFTALSLLILASTIAQAVVVSLGQVVYNSFTVSAGASTSPVITTNGMSLVGCQFPASMTATSMNIHAGNTAGGPFQPIYNSTGHLSYTVAGSRFVAMNPADFYGAQFLKIVLGSTEAADRNIVCSMKGI